MEHIIKTAPLLATPKKIFITCHTKPDADAIGSTLGLYHYLKLKGHHPVVVVPTAIPDFVSWMPESANIINYAADPEAAEKALQEASFAFCVDFSRLDRVRDMEPLLRNSPVPRVLIDHHLDAEEDAFAYGLCLPEKSSACEMVYDFIQLNGDAALINKDIMECLYTGTMTDTGSFRFPATSASVHLMLADFKNRGLDHSRIHELIYDSWGYERMRFLGYVLYNKMDINSRYRYGIITLTNEDQSKFKLFQGDTEGVVNYPLSIKGISISVFLKQNQQNPEEIKMSFRSRGNIDVSDIARKYFEGGGHFNAAGGRSGLSMDETVKKVKEIIEHLKF